MRVKHFSQQKCRAAYVHAPADKLWGGTQEIVLQQKIINPVSRSSFVVHLILAGGQMIENCREAECVYVWQHYVSFMVNFWAYVCLTVWVHACECWIVKRMCIFLVLINLSAAWRQFLSIPSVALRLTWNKKPPMTGNVTLQIAIAEIT